jgi:hypothetical protein
MLIEKENPPFRAAYRAADFVQRRFILFGRALLVGGAVLPFSAVHALRLHFFCALFLLFTKDCCVKAAI